MNNLKIEVARLVSCRIKRLKEALMDIRELRYVKLHGDEECEPLLKKVQEKLEFNILKYEERVLRSITSLEGYSANTDIEIRYLSAIDIKEGVVDISKSQDGSRLLDLTTGEISQQRS